MAGTPTLTPAMLKLDDKRMTLWRRKAHLMEPPSRQTVSYLYWCRQHAIWLTTHGQPADVAVIDAMCCVVKE